MAAKLNSVGPFLARKFGRPSLLTRSDVALTSSRSDLDEVLAPDGTVVAEYNNDLTTGGYEVGSTYTPNKL